MIRVRVVAALPYMCLTRFPSSSKISQAATFLGKAGGIAGAVSRTAVAPLERFKILLQTDTLPLSRSQDLVRSFTTMVRRDGLAGLFRGNGINVLRIVPYSAVQFSSYDVFKKLLVPSTATGLTTERRLAAGALAGMCSVTVTYPLDFLRTRISIAQLGSLPAPLAQLVGNSTIGPLKSSTRTTQTRIVPTALHVIRTEGGVLALYRGMGTSLVGVAPYMSLNLVLYEYLRDRSNAWLRARGTPPPETAAAAAPGAAPLSLTVALTRMLCGATAGGLAQTATYPLELIRRKLQMAMRGTRLRDLCATVWRVDGARGFWKGLTPNLIKVVPAAGVSFMTYECWLLLLR
ncbi:mitochondrial carrier domain-containing protein [Zopfochytrium polystomum]|nr:mitochondrial carrier domain-containing protein [Zopfochytrium polystomum]